MSDNPQAFAPYPPAAHRLQVERVLKYCCSTPESADYARQKIENFLAGRLPDFMEQVRSYAAGIEEDHLLLYSVEPSMQGKAPNVLPAPADKAAHRNATQSEQDYPKEPYLPVRMAFSIEETGESFIGYVVDGQPPDDGTKKRLNTLFLSFLATKRVQPIEENSNMLCQVNDNNEPILDAKGEKIPPDIQALKSQIMDDDTGFHAFMTEYAHGLAITQLMIAQPPSKTAQAQVEVTAPEEAPKQPDAKLNEDNVQDEQLSSEESRPPESSAPE